MTYNFRVGQPVSAWFGDHQDGYYHPAFFKELKLPTPPSPFVLNPKPQFTKVGVIYEGYESDGIYYVRPDWVEPVWISEVTESTAEK